MTATTYTCKQTGREKRGGKGGTKGDEGRGREREEIIKHETNGAKYK